MRDLLRKRSQLVRQRTASRPGLRNVLERTTARRLTANGLKKLTPDDLSRWIEDPNVRLSMAASLAMIDAASEQTSPSLPLPVAPETVIPKGAGPSHKLGAMRPT